MSAAEVPNGFALVKERNELQLRHTVLASRQFLAPGYVRIRVTGSDLATFDSPGADDHARLIFPPAHVAGDEDPRQWSGRAYTPSDWNQAEEWAEFEFVIHGGPGTSVASEWAATAPLGSPLLIGGPRGSQRFIGEPDSFFLAGDETAMPAIRRLVRYLAVDLGLPGTVALETGPRTAVSLVEATVGTQQEVVIAELERGNETAAAPLIEHLDSLSSADRPAGNVFCFLGAEQSAVKAARALFFDRWQVPATQASIRGYWKAGVISFHDHG